MSMSDLRVMLVDDDPDFRWMIKKQLISLGVKEIVQFSSAKGVIEDLLEGKADVVLCDWNMFGRSGIDVLKSVRKNEKIKDIPFIIVTSEADKEKVMEAIHAKVTDYIVKPVNKEVLIEKLSGVKRSK